MAQIYPTAHAITHIALIISLHPYHVSFLSSPFLSWSGLDLWSTYYSKTKSFTFLNISLAIHSLVSHHRNFNPDIGGDFPLDEAVIDSKISEQSRASIHSFWFFDRTAKRYKDPWCRQLWLFRMDGHGSDFDNTPRWFTKTLLSEGMLQVAFRPAAKLNFDFGCSVHLNCLERRCWRANSMPW